MRTDVSRKLGAVHHSRLYDIDPECVNAEEAARQEKLERRRAIAERGGRENSDQLSMPEEKPTEKVLLRTQLLSACASCAGYPSQCALRYFDAAL